MRANLIANIIVVDALGHAFKLGRSVAEQLVKDLIEALDLQANNPNAEERHRRPVPKLDAKFYGRIYKAKDGSLVPDDEWCVFLAKDNAFADAYGALDRYLERCESMGCDPAQMTAIKGMLARAVDWRMKNRDRTKRPDAAGERLLEV